MPRPALRNRQQNSFSKSPKRHGGQKHNDTNAHREYLQKKLANVEVGGRPDNSDDSDGIVTTRRNGRNRKGPEIYASGAVAKGDKPGAYPTRAQRSRVLREDTDEILSQRSRSNSRAASVSSARSVQVPATPEESNEKNETPQPRSSKRQKIGKIDTRPNGIPSSVQPETSVLGVIKPRKRQNSILETIGIGHGDLALDSSALRSDDEERFLPDEVSTPAQISQHESRPQTAKTSSSLKRKRGANAVTETAVVATVSSPLSSVLSLPEVQKTGVPELPRPSRSQQRKLSTTKRPNNIMDDIMAPPESSDSEEDTPGPALLPVKSPKTQRPKFVAPSTQQLQSLMPSKRERSEGTFQPQGEFELEEDSLSSLDDVDDQQGHSSFSPMKTRKGQGKATGTAQVKTKSAGGKKSGAKGSKTNGPNRAGPGQGHKSTRVISSTPSPVRLRTPLPLSTSKTRGSEAKSPSKQDTHSNTIMREKSTNTPSAAAKSTRNTANTKKRYGGSRRKEGGKENQPILLSAAGSGSDSASVDKEKLRVARQQADGPETKAWNKKWAGIDDFKLQFEEVSISSRSDSPTGLSR